MIHRRLVALVLPLLIAPIALAGCASSPDQAPERRGDLAPFRAKDLDGKSIDLADHLGKDVVLVSFWATYCEPCKAEMPFLQRYHDRYGKDGLTIVSVALDGPDTSAEVAPYIRKQGYTFRVVLDESGDIAQALNPSATAPFAILTDRHGDVVRRITGFQSSEADALEAEIKTLLAPAP